MNPPQNELSIPVVQEAVAVVEVAVDPELAVNPEVANPKMIVDPGAVANPEIIVSLEEALDPEEVEKETLDLDRETLKKIKDDLDRMIDAMNTNLSWFTRAAQMWSKVPLWQKIGAGLVITVPTLLLGILASIGTLLAISIVTAVVYASASIMLDNHHNNSSNSTEGLKQGIGTLWNMLSQVFFALENLRKEMANTIADFKDENVLLHTNVESLKEQVTDFEAQIERLNQSIKDLDQNNIKLGQTTETLEASVKKQTALLEESQQLLEQTQQDYKATQTKLDEQVKQFTELNTQMSAELEVAHANAKTFAETALALSTLNIKDTDERANFQDRLQAFLDNKQASFDTIATRICKAEEELVKVKDELAAANARYEAANNEHKRLLVKQDGQITRLERMERTRSGSVSVKPNAKGNPYVFLPGAEAPAVINPATAGVYTYEKN